MSASRGPRWASSLAVKLALPVALIAAAVLVLFLWATHAQVRALSIDMAGDRLEGAALELAGSTEAGVQARFERMRTLAELAPLRRYVAAVRRSPAATLSAPLMERLLNGGEAFAILDVDGSLLGQGGPATRFGPFVPPFDVAAAASLPAPADPTSGFYQVGPFRATGEVLYFDSWVIVRSEDGRVIAYLAQRDEVELSVTAREIAGGLVGLGNPAATLAMGSGRVWTDLAELVETPLSLAHVAAQPQTGLGPFVQRVSFRGPGGDRRLAAIAVIRQTPWHIVIERDEATTLAPVGRMTERLGALAMALVLLASLGALMISMSVTRPLDRIIDATRSLADFDDLPPVRRGDEFGRLSEAFRRMRDEVLSTRSRLEDEIRSRTAELEAAVHELEHARDELVRREKTNMLAQLSSAVSHEFRNCLAVIRNASFVIADIERDHSEQVDKQCAMLNRQVDLCERIIRNLLALGPTESPARRRVNLVDLLEEQLARLDVPPGVDIVRSFPSRGVEAHVDPVQVGQALFNLLTNALQAMPATGTLRLSVGPGADDTLVVEISDTGPGIRGEDRERVFEPLYTTKPSGTGLGLAISRALVRANGGEITVRNDPGAVFAIVLPGVEAQRANGSDNQLSGPGSVEGV